MCYICIIPLEDINCFQLTFFHFHRQLQEIQSKANSPGIGIGSLTGERRDTWHEVGKLFELFELQDLVHITCKYVDDCQENINI